MVRGARARVLLDGPQRGHRPRLGATESPQPGLELSNVSVFDAMATVPASTTGDPTAAAIATSVGNSTSQVGREVTRRALSIEPKISVSPGTIVTIFPRSTVQVWQLLKLCIAVLVLVAITYFAIGTYMADGLGHAERAPPSGG